MKEEKIAARTADFVLETQLREIACAAQRFIDTYNYFPPHAIFNANGERMLS